MERKSREFVWRANGRRSKWKVQSGRQETTDVRAYEINNREGYRGFSNRAQPLRVSPAELEPDRSPVKAATKSFDGSLPLWSRDRPTPHDVVREGVRGVDRDCADRDCADRAPHGCGLLSPTRHSL